MSLAIRVSTCLQPFEDIGIVFQSIKEIFPDWESDILITKESFPTSRKKITAEGTSENLENFIEILRKQRILDTAFDVMTQKININETNFSISRQAAVKGKIAFVIDDSPLGGTMEITIEKDNLEIWLEDQTWHHGREDIPRQMNDELSMKKNGEPVEWFDKFGNPTMEKDSEEE